MSLERSDSLESNEDYSLCVQQEIDKHTEFAESNLKSTEAATGLLIDFTADGSQEGCTKKIQKDINLIKQGLTHVSSTEATDELTNLKAKRKAISLEIKTCKEKILQCQEELKNIKTEQTACKKNYKSVLKAYKSAIVPFTTSFGFVIEEEDVKEEQYTVIVKFKNQNDVIDLPIKLAINRSKRAIMSIDASSVGISDQILFEDKEPPGVFAKLQGLVLQKTEEKRLKKK